MADAHRYAPGDVLRQKIEWGSAPKGSHALMIGYDDYNYVIIRLVDDFPLYSWMPAMFLNDRLYEKAGEVDLDSLPVNISDLVEFASEDDPIKWTNPPDLRVLRGCDVLKQYMTLDEELE